jgi:S-adenosylmethionine synthetase
LPGSDLAESVCEAAREYLGAVLHVNADLFLIESAVHNGSENLKQVFSRGKGAALANDTSFGCGHFPYSQLERATLSLARLLRSSDFHRRFPAAGDDFKIMGSRIEEKLSFTVAIALIDREVASVSEYFQVKEDICRHLLKSIDERCEIQVNALDDPGATDESGVYVTVTGLSAEHGDDGQVGRGNRVNGLITPCRTMSLEAAAGKNPIAHVGKIYNVLAKEMAEAVATGVEGISEVSIQILSRIGRAVANPHLVAIEVVASAHLDARTRAKVEEVAQASVDRIDELCERLIRGEIPVF